VDPRIELRFTGFVQELETDDAIDTVDTTTRWTLEGDFDVDRVWTVSASVGFAEIETRTTGGVTTVDGAEAGFLVSRALRNGGLSFSSDLVLTDDGWRNSVRLSRAIEMANGDTLMHRSARSSSRKGAAGILPRSTTGGRCVAGHCLSGPCTRPISMVPISSFSGRV
jgi:hypothetical protein